MMESELFMMCCFNVVKNRPKLFLPQESRHSEADLKAVNGTNMLRREKRLLFNMFTRWMFITPSGQDRRFCSHSVRGTDAA